MEQWLGRQIAVTFTVHQAANEPHARLYLDDVHLGSWRTPVVEGIAPNHVPAFSTTAVTITGQNFIAVPMVQLDDTTLQDVQWSDENTLLVTLPGSLGPGVYYPIVTNDGGQLSASAAGLWVGNHTFLPFAAAP
jgi:hypothetical protein